MGYSGVGPYDNDTGLDFLDQFAPYDGDGHRLIPEDMTLGGMMDRAIQGIPDYIKGEKARTTERVERVFAGASLLLDKGWAIDPKDDSLVLFWLKKGLHITVIPRDLQASASGRIRALRALIYRITGDVMPARYENFLAVLANHADLEFDRSPGLPEACGDLEDDLHEGIINYLVIIERPRQVGIVWGLKNLPEVASEIKSRLENGEEVRGWYDLREDDLRCHQFDISVDLIKDGSRIEV